MATFFIGYDVEDQKPEATRHFLQTMRTIHETLDLPCTLFILGRTLRQSPEEFRALIGHPLFDLQQHTETHVRFKTVYQENDDGVTVFLCGTPEQVREDILTCQRTFADILGFQPTGLTGPYNYYRGLLDRPDLVQIVHEAGIRFMRCFGRDAHDWQPTPFFAPFPLTALGFPDLWEYGIHGWQDCILRLQLGWSDLDGYVERVSADVDRVVAADGYFSYCQHDWSSIRADPEMSATRRILSHVKEVGMRIMTCAAHYAEQSVEPIAVAMRALSERANTAGRCIHEVRSDSQPDIPAIG
jgi:peptidoglycan/xylan/chitin deacetylase (PgdA/CDA1 family)